jgi:preprotein translocase subunit Sec61beta
MGSKETSQTSSESVDETMQRINKEEKKFQNFWVGVTSLVESYRYHIRKPEREPGHFVHAEQQETLDKSLVFNPNSRIRIIWDLMLGILLIYSVSMIPFRVGFDLRSSGREEGFDNFITSMFGLDILVQFNSAYLDVTTDKLVFDRKKIVQNYLSYWFWIDLGSTIPFDGITDRLEGQGVGASHPGAVRLIRAFRLIRFFKLTRYTRQNQQLEKLRIDPTLISLVMLMIQIFFIAHIFACFWHYIALEKYVGVMDTTWVETFGYSDHPVSSRYVASLYYVVVTMLTIGLVLEIALPNVLHTYICKFLVDMAIYMRPMI